MISANKLIYWFYYMYEHYWGYIFGKSGQVWTQKMQDRATNEMAKKYGKRWIGHYVTDCSGAFVYAYKQEGEKIYHGSDTIYKKYCGNKGKLVKGVREDGEPIKPGTAVFLFGGERNNFHHIGLYVGNDTCIEAKGTIHGVVVSRLNHWDYWGELKDVDYTEAAPITIGERKADTTPTKRMLRRGCKGDDVAELQKTLNSWIVGGEALEVDGKFGPKTATAVKLYQAANGLKADGIVGPMTWGALSEIGQNESGNEAAETDTVSEQTVTDVKPTHRTLKLGCKGDDVKALQAFINTWHGAGENDHYIEENGVFDANTKKMVRYYQRDRYLKDDGIVGPKTWEAIDNEIWPDDYAAKWLED